MESNEIKKALYKEKPIAQLEYIQNGNAYYYTQVKGLPDFFRFEVPVVDMGTTQFFLNMEAHLLIRWLV